MPVIRYHTERFYLIRKTDLYRNHPVQPTMQNNLDIVNESDDESDDESVSYDWIRNATYVSLEGHRDDSVWFNIFAMLSSNPNLTHLYLNECGLDDTHILFLLDALTTCSTIQVLDLTYNEIRTIGHMLAKFIRNKTSLKHISLMGNALEEPDLVMICEAMMINTSIQSVSLHLTYDDTIEYDDDTECMACTAMANMLKHNSCLTNVEWTNHNDVNINAPIVDAFAYNATVDTVRFDVGDAYFLPTGAYTDAWKHVFVCNTSLVSVSIFSGKVSEGVIRDVLDPLILNTSIVEINMCHCGDATRIISDDVYRGNAAADALCRVLRYNNTLVSARVSQAMLCNKYASMIRYLERCGNVTFGNLDVQCMEISESDYRYKSVDVSDRMLLLRVNRCAVNLVDLFHT